MSRPTLPAVLLTSVAAAMLAAAGSILSGCSADFSQEVANHPGCIADAQISQWKAGQCTSYGGADRGEFDNCLADRDVPPYKIHMLNECVEARSRY